MSGAAAAAAAAAMYIMEKENEEEEKMNEEFHIKSSIPEPKIPKEPLITKKIAAIEVIRWTKNLKNISLIGIVGYFVSQVITTFSKIIGLFSALIFIGIFTYSLRKATQETKRLEETYQLNTIKIQDLQNYPKEEKKPIKV